VAKGLAGGFPIGACIGLGAAGDLLQPGNHGTTFGGNPVACAAALAAIDMIEAEDLVGRARRIGELALPRLRALAELHPAVADPRGRGAMLAVELVRPDGRTPDPALLADVVRRCAAEGVVVLTAGTYGNVLRLLPPLVMGEDLLLDGLDVLDAAVAAALA